MWDNINLLINKKRLSSDIEKLQVENKKIRTTFYYLQLPQQFFLYAISKTLFIYYHFYVFNSYHIWPF